jgi:hypothetical protein
VEIEIDDNHGYVSFHSQEYQDKPQISNKSNAGIKFNDTPEGFLQFLRTDHSVEYQERIHKAYQAIKKYRFICIRWLSKRSWTGSMKMWNLSTSKQEYPISPHYGKED